MVDYITHVICGLNFDENEISQASDLYELPSVTEEWVHASVKLGRLATTKPYEPIGNKLFVGCTFALSDLSVKDRKTLFATITFHGGQVERNFTGKTTHLVCGAASGQAYAKAQTLGEKVTIVTPDWVSECIQSNLLVDAQGFHPKLLITMESQKAPEVPQQTLASIIGFDFEEGIAKTELPVPKSTGTEIPSATVTVSQAIPQSPVPVSSVQQKPGQMVQTSTPMQTPQGMAPGQMPQIRNKLILQQQPGGPRAVMQQQLQNKNLMQQQQFQLQIRQAAPPAQQNPVSQAVFQPAPQQPGQIMGATMKQPLKEGEGNPQEGNQTIIRQQLIQHNPAMGNQTHIIATPASQQMIQQHVLSAQAKAGTSQQQVQFIQATPQQAQKLKAGAMIQIQQQPQQQQQMFGGQNLNQQNKHIILGQQPAQQQTVPGQQQPQNIVIINQSSLKQPHQQQNPPQVTAQQPAQSTSQPQQQQQIMGQQPQNIQYLHTLQHQQQQMTFQMQQKPQLNMSGGQIVQQNPPNQSQVIPQQAQRAQPHQVQGKSRFKAESSNILAVALTAPNPFSIYQSRFSLDLNETSFYDFF